MNVHRLTSQIDFIKNYEEQFLNSPDDELYVVTLDKEEVIYGAETSCNIEFCKNFNINYYRQEKLIAGGCIVGTKGNIFIDIKTMYDPAQTNVETRYFAEALCKYFKSRGLNSVRLDNNDVLVDDYKVASGCHNILENEHGRFVYVGYQISIYQNLSLIKNACSKPMIKVPKGLWEYNITTEDIIRFINNYFYSKYVCFEK